MKVLYITTFNKEIYDASGRSMLESFFMTQKNGDILCCFEGLNPQKVFRKLPSDRLLFYDLAQSEFLQNWLKENSDVIPEQYGGNANKEKKPEAFLSWNFRAAGWFRKIATFHYALNFKNKYDLIVFVDSDSKFLKNIDFEVFKLALKNEHYFYHWGKERKKKGLGVESGFIGFKTSDLGLNVLNLWINKFNNKVFRRYLRWDDGGMFSNVLEEIGFKHGLDLVINYAENGKSQSHVIDRGVFSGYIIHDKGLHKRLGLTNEKK